MERHIERHIKTDEPLPIIPPLKALDYTTINKKFGWWSVVALVESWGRKQVCLYLWQRKGTRWARKQKFAIHSQEDWSIISDAVESLVSELG